MYAQVSSGCKSQIRLFLNKISFKKSFYFLWYLQLDNQLFSYLTNLTSTIPYMDGCRYVIYSITLERLNGLIHGRSSWQKITYKRFLFSTDFESSNICFSGKIAHGLKKLHRTMVGSLALQISMFPIAVSK